MDGPSILCPEKGGVGRDGLATDELGGEFRSGCQAGDETMKLGLNLAARKTLAGHPVEKPLNYIFKEESACKKKDAQPEYHAGLQTMIIDPVKTWSFSQLTYFLK